MEKKRTTNGTGKLVVVLGDQLSETLSSLAQSDPAHDMVLMAEVQDEASYVPHHKKKIALFLSAMRHFATRLRQAGWTVRYVTMDDPANTGSLTGEMERALADTGLGRVVVTEPGEHRVRQSVLSWAARGVVQLDMLDDDRFIASRKDFSTWASGRKQLRMEFFYRDMRRRTGLLMEGNQPVGGRWNFDSDNRKPLAPSLFLPRPLQHEPDSVTQEVLALVDHRFAGHFGTLRPFWFAVTREAALRSLEHFVTSALPLFGDYQDAMLEDEEYLYHSVLSHYLNVGLLQPMEVCRRVERAYHQGDVPLNAAEGFIRQVIGWREFLRGIYWMQMPGYTESNALAADRPLPGFFWSGETKMSCVAAVIRQTCQQAYAHHIQRLMVTGNFALLAGVDPQHVHRWYLAVYSDAVEWVEAPNVIGMSQFADGGLFASKPYASSGNYINKMSNHCAGCSYDVATKVGDGACPFNYLYWDFLDRNADTLQGNPRLAYAYRTWNRMSDERREAVRSSAKRFLNELV